MNYLPFKQISLDWRKYHFEDFGEYMKHDLTLSYNLVTTLSVPSFQELEEKIASLKYESTLIRALQDLIARIKQKLKEIKIGEYEGWDRRATKVLLKSGFKFMHLFNIRKTVKTQGWFSNYEVVQYKLKHYKLTRSKDSLKLLRSLISADNEDEIWKEIEDLSCNKENEEETQHQE